MSEVLVALYVCTLVYCIRVYLRRLLIMCLFCNVPKYNKYTLKYNKYTLKYNKQNS